MINVSFVVWNKSGEVLLTLARFFYFLLAVKFDKPLHGNVEP